MTMKKIIILKIGGRSAGPEILSRLAGDMKSLEREFQFVLVHGGGAEVTDLSARLGITSRFKDGIRMTGKEEMDVVDMVLSGKMNKQIVRIFGSCLKSVGLTGSDGKSFLGESIEGPSPEATRTGRVTEVNRELLVLLMENGFTPVVASTSMDGHGRSLNINADEAALHLACSLKAFRLIYISDIPGILKHGSVLSTIDRVQAEAEIKGGVISGGMIPKVRSSLEAIEQGVAGIVIGPYDDETSLADLIEGNAGTSILKIHS